MPRRWKLFLAIVPVAVIADQLTKMWARKALPVTPGGRGIRVKFIDGFWDWVLAENTGSAFSMLAGSRILLTVIALGAVGAILWLIHKAKDDQLLLTSALAMMAGGAVGNLIDRIATGRVTDFVLWYVGEHTWPVFNVADVLLVVAVGMFILSAILDGRRAKEGEPADAGAG